MRTTVMRIVAMTTRTMRRMIGCKRMRKKLSIAMMMKRMEPPAVAPQATPRKPKHPHRRRSKARTIATAVSASLIMTKMRRIRCLMMMMTRRKR